MSRGTVVLVVVAAALALGLYLTRGETEELPSLTQPLLDGHQLFEAKTIVIRNQPEAQPIELARAGYRFDVLEPVRDVASGARLQSVAAVMDNAQVRRCYERPAITDDLREQLGLIEPRAAVRIDFDDGVVEFEIGSDGPLGEEVWLAMEGEIYQGSNALWSAIQGNPDDFREAVVFLNTPSSMRRARVTRLGAAEDEPDVIELERRGNEYWLARPVVDRAHHAAAQGFLGSLLGVHVGSFVAGNSMPRPRPDIAIEVDGQYGSERLTFWQQPDGLLLGHQSPREIDFTVNGRDLMRMLSVPAQQLRSRIVIPVEPEEIVRFRLDPGAGRGKAVVLERGAKELFELHQPVLNPGNPAAAAELLDVVHGLAVQEFVGDGGTGADLAKFGLDHDYFTVEVTARFQPRPTVLHLGRRDGELRYVRRADQPYVLAVSADAAAVFERPWSDFVDRHIYGLRASDIDQVVIGDGGDAVTYTRGEDRGWRLDGRPVPAFADLVDGVLADLTAKDVASVDAVGDLGEGIALRLLGRRGAELVSLTIYRPADPDAGMWVGCAGLGQLRFRLFQSGSDALRAYLR